MWICKQIFGLYEVICQFFLKIPYARVVIGKPDGCHIALYYLCLILLLLLWRIPFRNPLLQKIQRRRKELTVVLGFVSIGLLAAVEMPGRESTQKIEITMIDVGQGDSIFLKGPEGKTYLVDGGSSDVKNVSKYRIEPFLKSQGVGKIDYVFISHGDMDHISGIAEMIDRMSVGVAIETIIFPCKEVWDDNLKQLAYLASENNVKIVTMSAGERLREGALTFTCLAPAHICKGESNANSMVLALEYYEFEMLFTGDVEYEGEETLTDIVKKYAKGKTWDVLKAAHHGSKNSTTEAFLDVTKPRCSLISAGRENAYGHPHEETLKRLTDIESKIYSTQECGAITIQTDGENMQVQGYLQK